MGIYLYDSHVYAPQTSGNSHSGPDHRADPTRSASSVKTPSELEVAVRRTEGVQPWRRAFHAACGIVIVAFVEYGPLDGRMDLLCLGVALLASLAIDWARLGSRSANLVFFRWFSALVSPREARKIASSTWYLTGAFITMLVAPRLFMPALLVLALADPAASVVGRLWGRHRLGKGSWEGAAAFFVVASAVLASIVGPGIALPAAALVAGFEVLPTGIDDNLTVPPVTALAVWLVGVGMGSSLPVP